MIITNNLNMLLHKISPVLRIQYKIETILLKFYQISISKVKHAKELINQQLILWPPEITTIQHTLGYTGADN